MASAVVFLIVLDTSPGRQSQTPHANFMYAESNLKTCDPISSMPILSEVSRALDVQLIPNWNTYKMFYKEFHQNEIKREFKSELSELETLPNGTKEKDKKTVSEIKLPDRTSLLAAIFETVSNVTALTCAGTLLSNHWVMTAASCVDMLRSIYSGIDKTSSPHSHYTVIVGSMNPLEEGSPHNVTQIMTPPQYMSKNNSGYVLMRIHPPFDLLERIQIAHELDGNHTVRSYGWIFDYQNTSEQRLVRPVSNWGRTIPSSQCRHMTNNTHVVCLEAKRDNDTEVLQMKSGGPVLIVQDNKVHLLGVVELGDDRPNIVYPLYYHKDWIQLFMG